MRQEQRIQHQENQRELMNPMATKPQKGVAHCCSLSKDPRNQALGPGSILPIIIAQVTD
jgi:hypothetical protein